MQGTCLRSNGLSLSRLGSHVLRSHIPARASCRLLPACRHHLRRLSHQPVRARGGAGATPARVAPARGRCAGGGFWVVGVITKPTQTPKLARALRDSSGCAKRSNGGEPAGELRDPHLRVHPGDSPLARATPAPIVQILQALTSCRASRTARGPDSHGIHARMRPSAAVCARQRWWVVGIEGGGGGGGPHLVLPGRNAPRRSAPTQHAAPRGRACGGCWGQRA